MSKVRAAIVGTATVATASVAAAVIMASPAEAPSKAPVRPSEPVSGTPRALDSHPDRSGARKPLTASPKPSKTTVTPTPTHSAKVSAPKSTPTATTERPKRTMPKPPQPIRITFYKDCTGHAQECIDAGTLTKYGNGTPILAGHNYDGYQWLSRVPVGKKVEVTSGPLAGTYEAYSHMQLNRRGGAIPDFGGASLVLQSCEGSSSTGFTLLKLL